MSEELRIVDSKRNKVYDQNHQNLLNSFKYKRYLQEIKIKKLSQYKVN
jgi:hypothetical protein